MDSSSVILSGADNTIFNNIGKIRWNKLEKLKIVTHHWGNDWNKGFKIYSELDELISEQKNLNLHILEIYQKILNLKIQII